MGKCEWCGADAEEAAKRHEGPHATWCVHFRRGKSPSQVERDFRKMLGPDLDKREQDGVLPKNTMAE